MVPFPTPANPTAAAWSALVADVRRRHEPHALAWLLEAGAPEAVVALPEPTHPLCRRCIATSRTTRDLLIRWREQPPPEVVRALIRAA
ncbi:MAG: hypothetical protein R3F59_05615 [Myxococcota bacterium]